MVAVVEGLDDILSTGMEMAPPNEAMLGELLAFHQVELKADQTILAIGYRAKSPLFDELRFDYPQVYKLGDSRHVSNILHAVWDGYEVARNL